MMYAVAVKKQDSWVDDIAWAVKGKEKDLRCAGYLSWFSGASAVPRLVSVPPAKAQAVNAGQGPDPVSDPTRDFTFS